MPEVITNEITILYFWLRSDAFVTYSSFYNFRNIFKWREETFHKMSLFCVMEGTNFGGLIKKPDLSQQSIGFFFFLKEIISTKTKQIK